MKNKLLVCYLFTIFDNESSFKQFINYYTKYEPGIDHDLLFCFKLLNKKQIKHYETFIPNVNYEIFDDPVKFNDFDFGSYSRLANKYPSRQILFLNSHSYPICEKWLLKLSNYSTKTTLIGTSASYESILDSIKLKKIYKVLSFFFKKMYFRKRFKSFPNPHIRTSSFLIYGQKLVDFMINKKINKKEDTWEIESGLNSLTNFFKKNNYKIFVINSDGAKFSENDWKLSETFNYRNQSKVIISDKHSRKYNDLSISEKKKFELKSWGI